MRAAAVHPRRMSPLDAYDRLGGATSALALGEALGRQALPTLVIADGEEVTVSAARSARGGVSENYSA